MPGKEKFDMDAFLERVKKFEEKYGPIGESAKKKKKKESPEKKEKKKSRGLMNKNQEKLLDELEGDY